MLKIRQMDSYRVYILLSFLSQLIFSLIFTVNLIYHVRTARLSPMQLILVGTILEASVFLFEVPTGVVADMISRKRSIVIGYAMMGAGFLLEGLFPRFWPIALAQVVWGTGYTFTSGATQAWISDEIGEESAAKAFVKGAQAGQLGGLAAIPVSMGIGLISVNIPILAGGALMILLALLLVLFMQERGFCPKKEGRGSRLASMRSTVRVVGEGIRMNRILLLLLGTGIFYGLYSEGFDRLWTAHLLEDFASALPTWTDPVVLFGFLRGFMLIASWAALEALNRRLDFLERNHTRMLLELFAASIVFALAWFALTGNLQIAIALFLLIGVLRSLCGPLLDTWLNDMVAEPGIRATMFSVKGQVDSLGQIAGGPLVGAFGSLLSIRMALLASAVLLSPVLILYRRIKRKSNF